MTGAHPVKAVTFDLFGTLLATRPWEEEVRLVQRIARARGLAVDPEAFLAATIQHVSARTATMRISRHLLAAGTRHALEAQGHPTEHGDAFAEALHALHAALPLFPDALPALDRVAPLPVAIISNATEEELQQILAATGLKARVQVAVSAERAGAWKPARAPFQLALRELGVRPEEALHVGDSLSDDVGGAKAAGMRAAWVNRNEKKREPGAPAPDGEGATLLEALAGLLPEPQA
ncbi:MAG TPA: HAD family hydrolase [Candidatus Thermoplasmatota archaeon]|nr:HAD family hydrolase [Candidatus Thermoplasmatota archaeon]